MGVRWVAIMVTLERLNVSLPKLWYGSVSMVHYKSCIYTTTVCLHAAGPMTLIRDDSLPILDMLMSP